MACHLKQKVFVWKEMKTIGIVCKLLQWHKDLGLVKKNTAEPMHLQKWVIHATVLIRLALHSFQSTSEIACAQCKQEYILWKMLSLFVRYVQIQSRNTPLQIVLLVLYRQNWFCPLISKSSTTFLLQTIAGCNDACPLSRLRITGAFITSLQHLWLNQ